MVKHIKNEDKQLLESLIEKYGSKGVEAAINKLDEWNMWDKPKSDDFYSAAIRQAERNRPRLIDVVDELPKRNHDAQRYKDDPEYHEHIKRLEAQLRKTTDPQEAEYLERRINKLKTLSESVIDGLNEDIKINEAFKYNSDTIRDYQYILTKDTTLPIDIEDIPYAVRIGAMPDDIGKKIKKYLKKGKLIDKYGAIIIPKGSTWIYAYKHCRFEDVHAVSFFSNINDPWDEGLKLYLETDDLIDLCKKSKKYNDR